MTTNEYMANVPKERREYLSLLRNLIKSNFPGIVEDMSYLMPTFIYKGDTLCSIANEENQMALYITPFDLLDHFKDQLKPYNHAASCIQFKKLDKNDLELFDQVLKYCANNISKSRFYSRMNSKNKSNYSVGMEKKFHSFFFLHPY